MNNWKKIKLADCFRYLPKSKHKAGDGMQTGVFPFYTSSQKQTLWFDKADYNCESLIFATGGRPSVHYSKKFSTSTDNFIITSDNSRVNIKFVFYYFKKNIDILEKGFKGVGLKHLSKDYLNKIELLFPLNSKGDIDIDKQNQIVKILEEAENLVNKKETIKDKIKKLDSAIFNQYFGNPLLNSHKWDIKKLGELCDIRRGASPRPISKFIGDEVPWIKIGDGTNGDELYLRDTKVKITKEGAKKSVYLEPGSIIFANCGVSLGFARILKTGGCIHDGWLAFDKINDSLNKIYLLKLLNTLTLYFRTLAPDGTQPNLNTTIMKNLKIILPPIELQNKFVEVVMLLEDQKDKQLVTLEKVNILFNSLMQKVFSK